MPVLSLMLLTCTAGSVKVGLAPNSLWMWEALWPVWILRGLTP